MTKIEIQLKNKIMRRVYVIWMLKKALSFSFLRIMILSTMFVLFVKEVSVLDVLHNLPGQTDIIANLKYMVSAFSTTRISVQFYIMGITITTLWFLVDAFRKRLFVFNNASGQKIL